MPEMRINVFAAESARNRTEEGELTASPNPLIGSIDGRGGKVNPLFEKVLLQAD